MTAYLARIHMLIFSYLDREESLKSECEGYMMTAMAMSGKL